VQQEKYIVRYTKYSAYLNMSCRCQTITEKHQAYINGLRTAGPSSDRCATTPPPATTTLGGERRPIWNGLSRINEDPCTVKVDETQSQVPGCYNTNNFFRWSTTQKEYADYMMEPAHYQKVYRDACSIDADSELRLAPPTNYGQIQQLYRAPYTTVPYMGAGSAPTANIGLESELMQGMTNTTFKSCEPTSGVTINRFQCLPDFGNPQKVERIVPVWVRGGENTRDFVRRVNYDKYCMNQANNNIVNRR